MAVVTGVEVILGGLVLVTLTVAATLRKGVSVMAAWTVSLNSPTLIPAVNSPSWESLPPPLSRVQVTLTGSSLPKPSSPRALNWIIPPTLTDGSVGTITSFFSSPLSTVTEASPVIAPAVAVTVLVYRPGVLPPVNSPLLSMVPPPAATVHLKVTAGISFLFESKAAAANCMVPPTFTVASLGSTVTDAMAGRMTSTEAVPVLPPASAVTVSAKLPGFSPAVKRPEASMVPPPLATFQTKVWLGTSFLCLSIALAPKAWVWPTITLALAGETSTVSTSPATTVTAAVPVWPPAEAVT